MGTRMRPFLTSVIASVVVIGCGGASAPPAKSVSVRFKGAPADATVIVDDVVLGNFDYVASRGIALPKGEHRITIQSAGYFPWDKLVIAAGDPIRLDVQLVKIPE